MILINFATAIYTFVFLLFIRLSYFKTFGFASNMLLKLPFSALLNFYNLIGSGIHHRFHMWIRCYTYVTGSYRLTPKRTECKHFLKDSVFNSLHDRICLPNSLGGVGVGGQTHSQPSVYI